MYSPPNDAADQQRTLAAQDEAATALGVTIHGHPRWGHQGRTLGQPAHHPLHGPCWLRLTCTPADKTGGKLWEGTQDAAAAFPTVNKPALYAVYDGTVRDKLAWRAELTQHVDTPVCSPEPVLSHELDLPGSWWSSLRADLETIATTATDRVAVRRQWIDRAVPAHTGRPAPVIEHWQTAHGDCHFANLTTSGPVLLDFEGFGLAPVGYDPAMLYTYSLLAPKTAARVRTEFPVLDSPAGQAALLVVIADLLQSASRGDHPELTRPLRAMLTTLP